MAEAVKVLILVALAALVLIPIGMAVERTRRKLSDYAPRPRHFWRAFLARRILDPVVVPVLLLGCFLAFGMTIGVIGRIPFDPQWSVPEGIMIVVALIMLVALIVLALAIWVAIFFGLAHLASPFLRDDPRNDKLTWPYAAWSTYGMTLDGAQLQRIVDAGPTGGKTLAEREINRHP